MPSRVRQEWGHRGQGRAERRAALQATTPKRGDSSSSSTSISGPLPPPPPFAPPAVLLAAPLDSPAGSLPPATSSNLHTVPPRLQRHKLLTQRPYHHPLASFSPKLKLPLPSSTLLPLPRPSRHPPARPLAKAEACPAKASAPAFTPPVRTASNQWVRKWSQS